MLNNFQTVRFRQQVAMNHSQEIEVALSESAEMICPQRPLTEIFELIYQYSIKYELFTSKFDQKQTEIRKVVRSLALQV